MSTPSLRTRASAAAICLRTILLFCVAIAAGQPAIAAPPARAKATKPASGVVTISVHPAIVTANAEVAVGDVATIEGGDAALRSRIAGLDLADAPELGKSTRLSRELITHRIRIAGVEAAQYKIQGADAVSLTSRGYRVPDQEIVDAAKAFLITRLPWNADDITIELTRAIRGPVLVPGGKEDVRFEAKLGAPRVSSGTMRVDVTILSKGVKQSEVQVSLEVHHLQTIAIASRRVERGQTLTNEDVYFERRTVDAVSGYLVEAASPVGQRVKRAILPLQTITRSDLESTESETEVVIRQRDVVKLVVRTGNLTVSTTGEALQDGRTGQAIRVRNVDSKAVITGRVVNRNEVQVLY